jgi:hypothetical protein
VTDLESGAIVQAEVLEGDHADTKALSERVACAVEVANRIVTNEEDGVVRSLTADKGYFAIEEIAQIQEFDIRTVIGDANAARPRKFIVPPVPSRATLAKRFCASAACTWNAALSTSLTKADCAEPHSKEQKISLSGTRSRRPALT